MPNYVKPSVIQKNYDISSQTLRRWVDQKKVKSVILPDSNRRLIDYDDFLSYIGNAKQEEVHVQRKKICYARVSSSHQKEDLERQIQVLKTNKEGYEIIKDIGSGLNWKRKGLETLLELVTSDLVSEVVVTHKDRLSRFAFDLLQWLFKKHNCSIVVLNEVTESNPQVEIAEDILSIITYFTAKNNGMRSAKNRTNRNIEKQKNKTISNTGTEDDLVNMVRSQEMGV